MLSNALALPTESVPKDVAEDPEYMEKLLRGDIELTPCDSINAHLVRLLQGTDRRVSEVRGALKNLIEGSMRELSKLGGKIGGAQI